jgi:hypothetical protein
MRYSQTKMKVLYLLLASLTAATALPNAQGGHSHGQATAQPASAAVQPGGAPMCEYSAFEKFNLGHNHDVNTGSLLSGGKVVRGAPKVGGSGCAPAWAVGGDPSDKTPTRVTAAPKLTRTSRRERLGR